MRPLFLLVCFTAITVCAAERRDWASVTALDAGPQQAARDAGEARTLALRHLDDQERALRGFLGEFPADEHVFEARLRLARLLIMRGEMKSEAPASEAEKILAELAKGATADQQAELDFFALGREMRRWQMKRPSRTERREVLEAARKFQRAHATDRRLPAVLAEVARLFEPEPAVARQLLSEARDLGAVGDLKLQIADDLKRLDFFESKLNLRCTGLDGKAIDLVQWRGNPVVIVFFSTESDPARTLFAGAKRNADALGAQFLGISIDRTRAPLDAFLRAQPGKATVAWDGRGWESPLVRTLGVNAVPVVWLLDRTGVVRSLDPLDDFPGEITRLTQ